MKPQTTHMKVRYGTSTALAWGMLMPRILTSHRGEFTSRRPPAAHGGIRHAQRISVCTMCNEQLRLCP
jgi:hypothetical protein